MVATIAGEVNDMQDESQSLELEKHIQDFLQKPMPAPLCCGVQHYEWGGMVDIPALLGIESDNNLPYAELWIGAHHALPSQVKMDGAKVALNTLISRAPERVMGNHTVQGFDAELPFLLKVISARKPLSIQAHPNKQQAKEGFARENKLGIDRNDVRRNYRDGNHKPELISALSDFYALCGFRPLHEIASLLQSIPEFRGLALQFTPERSSLIELYTQLMKMSQQDVNALLTPVVGRFRRENDHCPFEKHQFAYWVLRADQQFSTALCRDRGIFSLFLLNLIHLKPGQAMFLPAGELHAYLEGTGVEVMANSNNVLRGGLTPKHIDVDELLSIMTFECGEPRVLRPKRHHRYPFEYYETPAKEFALWRLSSTEAQTLKVENVASVQLAVVIRGALRLAMHKNDVMPFSTGDVFMIPAGIRYELAIRADTVVYWANVPAVN